MGACSKSLKENEPTVIYEHQESGLMINSNALKYFYFTAKLHSIRKAAHYCNVSQPAVSQAIKKLEEELDATLLIRNANSTQLTNRGRELYDFAKRYWEDSQKLRESFQKKPEDSLHLKVGINRPYDVLFTPLIRKFLQDHSGLTSEFVFDDGEVLRQKFARGELDVIHTLNVDQQELVKDQLDGLSMLLFVDKISLVSCNKHPLQSKKKMRLKDISEFPLLLPTMYTQPVLDQFEASNLKPKLGSVLNHGKVAARLLPESESIAILSHFNIPQDVQSQLAPLIFPDFEAEFLVVAEFQSERELLDSRARNLYWDFLEKNRSLLKKPGF